MMTRKITKEDCVLELPELEYDKNELLKIYEQVKDHARVKYFPLYPTPAEYTKPEDSPSLSIQYNDYEIRNPADHGKGVNLLDFDYINRLAQRINFNFKLHPANVSMLIYKDGTIFRPHVDGYSASVVMFPIIVSSTLEFYHEPGMTYEACKEYEMGYDKIVYSHTYPDTYATLFNSHVIHGVKPTTGFQVKLRFNTNEQFYSIREKYKNKNLILS